MKVIKYLAGACVVLIGFFAEGESVPENKIIAKADAKGSMATLVKLSGVNALIETNVASVKFNVMVPKSAVSGATQTTYSEMDVIGIPSNTKVVG